MERRNVGGQGRAVLSVAETVDHYRDHDGCKQRLGMDCRRNRVGHDNRRRVLQRRRGRPRRQRGLTACREEHLGRQRHVHSGHRQSRRHVYFYGQQGYSNVRRKLRRGHLPPRTQARRGRGRRGRRELLLRHRAGFNLFGQRGLQAGRFGGGRGACFLRPYVRRRQRIAAHARGQQGALQTERCGHGGRAVYRLARHLEFPELFIGRHLVQYGRVCKRL